MRKYQKLVHKIIHLLIFSYQIVRKYKKNSTEIVTPFINLAQKSAFVIDSDN